MKFPEFLARDYSRILQRVELLWGGKEALNYLDSLILGDSSDRSVRQGFTAEVINEIVHLKQTHEFLFPALDVNPYDPFSGYVHVAPVKNTGSSTAATLPIDAPAAQDHVNQQALWPAIRSQRELIEKAELLRSGARVYELQGKQIGEILMHYRIIDEKTLLAVRQTQEQTSHKGKSFGQILVKVGLIKHDDLVRALCIQAGILMVDILNLAIPFEILRLIPSAKARERQAIPTGVFHETLFLAVADPLAFKDQFLFTKLSGCKIVPVFAQRHEIVNRLNRYN